MLRRLSLLVLLIAAGCSRCGEKSAAAAEELLPAHPPLAVVTAPLGSIMGHLATLADRAATLPGGDQLAELRKGFTARLGFDPFTREGLLADGVDPDRGAALAILSDGKPPDLLVALPLANPELFMEKLQSMLVQSMGYSPAGEGTRFARRFERRGTQLGLGVVRGYGVIARGPEAMKLFQQPPSATLAADAGLKAMRGKLGGQDLLMYAPQGSPLPSRYGAPPLPGDLALGVTSSAQGLALRLIAQLPPDAAARVQAVLPGGGASLANLLPADAAVRARLGIAAPQVLTLLQRIPQLAPLLDKPDVAELFASLAPGASLSLGLEKTANLGQLVDYGLDWRRKSPFETVQLVALAQVADQQRFAKALEALALRLPSLGAQVAHAGDDFQITYSGGKGARFGSLDLGGKKVAYVVGGALGPMELKSSPPDRDPDAAALFQDAGAAGLADFGKLYDAVHALPQEAYGSGPQSYVTRSLVGQVVDPLKPLRISLGVMAGPGSLDASLTLALTAQ
jgi:hypothetical protein